MSDQAQPAPERVDVYYCELRKASEPITLPVTKIGGAPVFLQPADWPTCRHCGQPLQFLAQFRLDEPLRLAEQYQMAYVFMCETCEESWDPDAGRNAVLLHPPSPDTFVQPTPNQFPDYAVTMTPGQEPLVDRTDSQFAEDLREEVELGTKVGGVPGWIQQGWEIPACLQCDGPTRFIAQLEGFGEWDGSKARFVEQNFGDSGSSYIFICQDECSTHGAAFLWQCF